MSRKNVEFLDIFILMSILNFMLNWVEHKKSFITSEPLVVSSISKDHQEQSLQACSIHVVASWKYLLKEVMNIGS